MSSPPPFTDHFQGDLDYQITLRFYVFFLHFKSNQIKYRFI